MDLRQLARGAASHHNIPVYKAVADKVVQVDAMRTALSYGLHPDAGREVALLIPLPGVGVGYQVITDDVPGPLRVFLNVTPRVLAPGIDRAGALLPVD